MARKKNMPSDEATSGGDSQASKGFSKEAWIAIGTIAAALITGAVTLLVHVLPKGAPPPAQSSLSSPSPSPSSHPSAVNADAIAGKWAGTAQDSNSKVFQITLDVRRNCALNERCGAISVSNVPCYGEVFLEKAQDNEFEFRVDNFYGRSDPKRCQPGAGEIFRLRPDGRLGYSTTYEPKAQGILERTGD
jgi:hypothetical protein